MASLIIKFNRIEQAWFVPSCFVLDLGRLCSENRGLRVIAAAYSLSYGVLFVVSPVMSHCMAFLMIFLVCTSWMEKTNKPVCDKVFVVNYCYSLFLFCSLLCLFFHWQLP